MRNKFKRLSEVRQAFIVYDVLRRIKRISKIQLAKHYNISYREINPSRMPKKKKALLDEIVNNLKKKGK